MAAKVVVDREALHGLLNSVRDEAFRRHCRYDPGVKHHVFSDEMWARANPTEFERWAALMAPLLADEPR